MTVSPIEIGNLLKFITENKDIKSHLSIDHNCRVNAQDPKPLIKILNYLINYLNQITKDAINVTLNTQSSGCLLCFIASTDETELPPLSENINEALKPYNAAMRLVFEEGKYVQIILNFCEGHVPDSVVIEV